MGFGPAEPRSLGSRVQRRDPIPRLGAGIRRGWIWSPGCDGDFIEKGFTVRFAGWGRAQDEGLLVNLVLRLLPKLAFHRSQLFRRHFVHVNQLRSTKHLRPLVRL